MRTWATIATAALLALGLAGLAEARGHAGKRGEAAKHDVLQGKIQSVAADGKSLVVARKGGTVTVTVGANTRVQLRTAKHRKAQPGTLAALQVGKHVKVTPATGTAERIVILGLPRNHRAKG